MLKKKRSKSFESNSKVRTTIKEESIKLAQYLRKKKTIMSHLKFRDAKRMTKAKVVGEDHASSKNVEELDRMVKSGDFDAVFIEGREDKIFEGEDKPSLSYLFFLLGWVELLIIVKFCQVGKKKIYNTAKKLEIPVFGSIDASIPRIFDMGKGLLNRFLFPILFLISFFLLVYSSNIQIRVMSFVLLLAIPILSFSLAVMGAGDKRNDHMANSIIEKVKTNNFSNILVSCGNSHVDGIASNLKRHGIEVDAIKLGRWSFFKQKKILVPIILILILIIIVLML